METNYSHIKTIADISKHPEFMLIQGAEVKPILEQIGQWTYEDTIGGLYVLMNNGEYIEVFGFEGEFPDMGKDLIDLLHMNEKQVAATAAFKIIGEAVKHGIKASDCATVEEFAEKIFNATHISYGKAYLLVAYHVMKKRNMKQGGSVDSNLNMEAVDAIFNANEKNGKIKTFWGDKKKQGFIEMLEDGTDDALVAIFDANQKNGKIRTYWGDKTFIGFSEMVAKKTMKEGGSVEKKYTESLAEIKRKYKGLIIMDTSPITIFKDYFLKKSKNGYGVEHYFYAIPMEKFKAFIEQQKQKSSDFKKGAESSDDDWALRFLARYNIWGKYNTPKDISAFLSKVEDSFYDSDRKGIRFEQGGSVSSFTPGDLVYVKNAGMRGLVGLVTSDLKSEPNEDEKGYDVYLRGMMGEIMFVTPNEMVDITDGHLSDAENNGDIIAYGNIAQKLGITLNPKYQQTLDGWENDDEFKTGGSVKANNLFFDTSKTYKHKTLDYTVKFTGFDNKKPTYEVLTTGTAQFKVGDKFTPNEPEKYFEIMNTTSKKSDFKLVEVQRLIELAENGNKQQALKELKDYVSNYKASKEAGEKAYFGRSIDSIIDEYQNAVEYVANMQEIPNNYVGKTAEQVWDKWTVAQRNHFVSDHNLTDNMSERTLKMSSAQLKADKWGKEFGNQTSWDWISGVLHEHISQGEYKKGGIINQYKGKTAEQVWNDWTEKQRFHFVHDHIADNDHLKSEWKQKMFEVKYSELPSAIKSLIDWHVSLGQYKQGGTIKTPSGAKWNKFKADFIESAMRNGSLTKAQANELFQDFNHIMVKEFNNGEDGYSTWYAHNYQYAVEYRDMHTAIHNLITTKYPDKEKAKEIYANVKEIENSETENQYEDLYHQLNNMDIDDTFEINFREIQDIGGNKYYGTHDQVMIINQNVPDKYAKGGNIKQPINYQKKWKVTYLTFQGTKGTKEITLGRMSNRDDVKQALKRMGTAQDLNIREVLSIDEVMEQGGSIQSVNEYLEEIFNADSFVDKFIYLTTPSRGKHLTEEELYAAFTSGQAAKVLEEYDPSAFYQLRNDMESSGYPSEPEQQYAVTITFAPKYSTAVKTKIENALEVSLDDNSMLYFDKGDDYFEIHGLTYKEEQSLEREFSDSDMAEFSSQEMAKKGMWIKKALTGNKGALRRTARQRGLLRNMDEKLSMTDLKKLQKMSPLTAKRAHLAETLRKFESGGEVNDMIGKNVIIELTNGTNVIGRLEKSNPIKVRTDATSTRVIPNSLIKNIQEAETLRKFEDGGAINLFEWNVVLKGTDGFEIDEVVLAKTEDEAYHKAELLHKGSKAMGITQLTDENGDIKYAKGGTITTAKVKSALVGKTITYTPPAHSSASPDNSPEKFVISDVVYKKNPYTTLWDYTLHFSNAKNTALILGKQEMERLLTNGSVKMMYMSEGATVELENSMEQGGTIPAATVDEVLKHYIMAGLWAETNVDSEDADDSFEKKYSASDIAPDSLSKMREKVTEFLSENNDAVTSSGLTNEEVGHSLWLTQNHHGAGFFDYTLDADVEKQLTAGAHKLGEGYLEVGDDGKIHIHYGRSMKQGGNINSYATVTDYLNSLSEAQLPPAAAAYLREELLNDSTLNLLSPNDADVKAIADFISEKFETALPQPVEVGEEVPEYVPPVIVEFEEEPVFVPEPEPEPEPIAYSAEVTKFMDEAAMVAEILDTITGTSKKDQKERAKFVDELKMIIEIVESENEQAARKMEVDYASYLGIEHKSVLGATKKEAKELADKLANAESEVNEKLKIESGGQLYNDIYLQKQFKYEMDKKLGNLLQGKLISMDVYNLLEDDNYHALNAYLSMSGYYGKEQEVKQKNLGNAKHVYNTVLSASIYKDGGKIEPGYQLELKDWTADVYEDDFEEGEGKHVNSFSGEVNKIFGSIDDLLKYIGDRITYEDAKKENFSVNDDGRIDTSVLVDSENSPASKSEIEKWKNGELKLYNANYSFYVLLVSQKTPTVEELSSLLGIKMKNGGKVQDKEMQGYTLHVTFEDLESADSFMNDYYEQVVEYNSLEQNETYVYIHNYNQDDNENRIPAQYKKTMELIKKYGGEVFTPESEMKEGGSVGGYDAQIVEAIRSYEDHGWHYINPTDVIRLCETEQVYAHDLRDDSEFLIIERTNDEIQKLIDSNQFAFFTEDKIKGYNHPVIFEEGMKKGGKIKSDDSMKRGGDVATASATEIDHVGIEWQSSFSPADREVIEDDVHQHVSEMVKQGFHSGELTDGGTEPSYSGWWSVDIEEDDNDAEDRNNEVSEKIRQGYTSGYNPNFSFGANVWNNDKPKSKKKTKDNDDEEPIVHAPDAIDKGDFNAASVKWFDGITKYASTPAGKQDLQGLLKIAEESSYIRQNLRKFVVEIKKTNIPQPFKKKLNSHASRINNRGFNEFEHQFGGKTKGSTKPSATEEYFKLFIQAVKANDKAQGGKLN